MTLNSLRRGGLAVLLFAAFGKIRATAGPVYLFLNVDPATTAGAGVPAIAREYGTGTFTVTSTKSGFGSWHLFALDDVAGSFGIAGFSVKVGGNLSNVSNRSTTGNWENFDVEGFSEESGSAGFSDIILRSGVGSNPTNPVQGNQRYSSDQDISGMGMSAGSLNNAHIPLPGDQTLWSSVTSGQWGNYATSPSPINGKNWLFLGEGNYTGAVPTIDLSNTFINHYDTTNPLHQTPVNPGSIQVDNCFQCFGPIVKDVDFTNVNANNPGLLTLTMSLQAFVSPSSTWSNFTFNSFVPAGGGSGTGPATPATFDTSTQKFTWSTVGSPPGTYKWLVTATNVNGSDQGSITVHLTVPEPAALTLVGLCMFGGCGLIGRRGV